MPFEIFWKWKSAPRYWNMFSIDSGRKKSILSMRVRIKQKDIPVIKAMIWFRVRDEANSPIAVKAAPSNIAPIYPPVTGPQSRSPINEIKTL